MSPFVSRKRLAELEAAAREGREIADTVMSLVTTTVTEDRTIRKDVLYRSTLADARLVARYTSPSGVWRLLGMETLASPELPMPGTYYDLVFIGPDAFGGVRP